MENHNRDVFKKLRDRVPSHRTRPKRWDGAVIVHELHGLYNTLPLLQQEQQVRQLRVQEDPGDRDGCVRPDPTRGRQLELAVYSRQVSQVPIGGRNCRVIQRRPTCAPDVGGGQWSRHDLHRFDIDANGEKVRGDPRNDPPHVDPVRTRRHCW
jgi:hypothetical protein